MDEAEKYNAGCRDCWNMNDSSLMDYSFLSFRLSDTGELIGFHPRRCAATPPTLYA
jgi:hypothetical protein